jgi:hypothetical protein
MPEDLTAADGEFVSTAVALERIPSRQLVDSICCRFGGPNDDFVQALDGANAVVMSGAADKLAVYVALARELDRNATLEESKATDGPANK